MWLYIQNKKGRKSLRRGYYLFCCSSMCYLFCMLKHKRPQVNKQSQRGESLKRKTNLFIMHFFHLLFFPSKLSKIRKRKCLFLLPVLCRIDDISASCSFSHCIFVSQNSWIFFCYLICCALLRVDVHTCARQYTHCIYHVL